MQIKQYMNDKRLQAIISELVEDKDNELNPNERKRFNEGAMGVGSMIRLLEQYTAYEAMIVPVFSKNVDAFNEHVENRMQIVR